VSLSASAAAIPARRDPELLGQTEVVIGGSAGHSRRGGRTTCGDATVDNGDHFGHPLSLG
jgi:hypothetical protein